MAGLKKKKTDKSGSPNVVLVIFMVFFIMLSIGLGIFGYYGYAEQADLRTKRKQAEDTMNGEKTAHRFYATLYQYTRQALGDTLEEKEATQFNDNYEELFVKGESGVFKNETEKEAAKAFIFALKKKLKTEDADKEFKLTYPKIVETFQEKMKDTEAKINAANAKAELMEQLAGRLTDKQDKFHKAANDRIAGDADAQLAEVKKQSDTFRKTTENNKDLIDQLKKKDDEVLTLKEEHDKDLNALKRKIAEMDKERKDIAAAGAGPGGAAGGNVGRGGDSPLLLDISTGKPLWDQPAGKITRVDLELRTVNINLGSSHGVKPELTFNIFGAGSSGRALGQLKGTIEIIKVNDASTSTARITSLYDSDGREILLNLQTRGRTLRETEVPVREGDLLYNMFWGTRVAIVGYVSITGEATDNPSEQNRQMLDFKHLLERQGMQVDAYVDMRDGKLHGALTPKTRYLIRGDTLITEAKAAPPAKVPDEDKDKEKEKKEPEPAKEAGINLERNDAINKASRALYMDAKDRGLLIISQENFATVIGYRKARSANIAEASSFRPGLPFAGAGQAGVIVAPDRPERPMGDEKKDAEMEKK